MAFESANRTELLAELKTKNPIETAAQYSKRMAEFREKLDKQIKESNDNLLTKLIANINPNCSNVWNTKYALNDIGSLQYYLGCCNGNVDSSLIGKAESLKSQESILQEKMIAFQNGHKDSYTIKMGENNSKNGGLDIPV